jgi:DNA-binding transcriptional MerR regulator
VEPKGPKNRQSRVSSRSDSRRRKATSAAHESAAGAEHRTFKIGEAAKLVGVQPFVLRFWETQFPILKPVHTQSKHRVYHQRDIQTLKLIKRLLHQERFTIEGAKKHIRQYGLDHGQTMLDLHPRDNGGSERAASPEIRERLIEIRRELESIHQKLTE